jgi:chromate transport protein ChrA
MKAVAYFLRLGTIGFGGPIATVDFMQRDLVEHRGWIDRRDLLDGVAPGQGLTNRRDSRLWVVSAAVFAVIAAWPTTAIALVTLALLWRFKIPEPVVIVAVGSLGLLTN